jgi:hypothetical protein
MTRPIRKANKTRYYDLILGRKNSSNKTYPAHQIADIPVNTTRLRMN